jgi:large repetitive protein
VPRITTEFPSQVTSGQSISFNLNVENSGSSFGYGPFVDVLIPPNVSASSSAAFLDMTLSPSASVTFTNVSTCTAHPVAKFANGTAQTVCGQSGWRFLSYRFPLLSFAPSQPALTASLSGQMPNTAIDTNWSFMARAGFQYLDVSGSPLSGMSAWATNNVSQRLTKTDVSFNATEFSVGPQFIYQCTIVTTLASGMITVNGTIIVDLPCGVYLTAYSINTQVNYTMLPTAPGSNRLVLSVGDGNQTINAAAISLSFVFYLNDTGLTCPGYGNGGIRTIPFSVTVNWSFWSSVCNCTTLYIPGTVTKSAQSIPLLLTRSVSISSDANAAGWSPLDAAAHSYSMRVSAGRCYSSVVFKDALADGLVYDEAAFPNFVYNGTGSLALSDASLTRSGVSPSMQIDISSQLQNLFDISSGILRGPSTISIAMPGSVLDRRASGGNIFHGEKFTASAMVLFSELNCTTLSAIGTPTNVSSGNSIRIVYGTPSISVYAVGGISPPSTMVGTLPGVWPTAPVTLRMRKSLPTSDIAGLTLDAFLPHPVLLANQASSVSSLPSWSGSVPAAGSCSMGPADTVRTVTGNSVAPSLSIDAGNNRILFTWSPDYENPLNTGSQIDVLCTFTATSLYFPDGLTIGMTSRGSETYVGDLYSFLGIAMMEPVVNFKKTIGTSSNSASIISPANSINLFSGATITSSALSTATFGGSISNVDAGDSISIALIIESTGSYEAYDVSVRDTIPANFAVSGSVTCVTGSQQSVSYSGDFFSFSGASIAQIGRSSNTGSNIVVCSYTLVAQGTLVASSSSVAVGTLFNYAGAPSGPDFAATDLNSTVSFVVASPSNTIQIWSTDVAATSMGATYQQVTVGESVTYLVNITFPEGSLCPECLISHSISELRFFRRCHQLRLGRCQFRCFCFWQAFYSFIRCVCESLIFDNSLIHYCQQRF